MKIGLFGAGKIAEKHIVGYQQLKGVELLLHDVNPERKKLADQYGIQWVDDPFALYRDESLKAVDVCTPTPFHSEIILQALEHGKHVLCEKPLAMNLDEALHIRDVATQANRLVYIGFPYRFHPAFQQVKALLDNNIIGKPHFASFRLGGRGSHQPWKHIKAQGGGVANEMLVHMVDLAQWYFGEFTQTQCLLNKTLLNTRDFGGERVEVDGEDLLLLKMTNKTGVEILCQSDFITPGYMNHVEIQGDNGSVFTSILSQLPTMIHCQEARGDYKQGQTVIHHEPVNLFAKELQFFVEVCGGENPAAFSNVEESIAKQSLFEKL